MNDKGFWGLCRPELAKGVGLKTFSKAAGEPIFEQGDAGRFMYVVRHGEIEIRNKGTAVATIGKGEWFGEAALFDHVPRSASAVAKSDCEFAPVTRSKFLNLVKQEPEIAILLIERLSRSLAAANEK